MRSKLRRFFSEVALIALLTTASNASEATCSDATNLIPDVGLYFYQKDTMHAPKRILVQENITVQNYDDDHIPTFTITADANYSYCILLAYKSEKTIIKYSKPVIKKYILFFNTQYILSNNYRSNAGVVFANFGMENAMSVTLAKTDWLRFVTYGLSGIRNFLDELMMRDIAREFYPESKVIWENGSTVRSQWLGFVRDNNDKNSQYVVEMTRFSEKQDQSLHVVSKLFSQRQVAADRAKIVMTLIDPAACNPNYEIESRAMKCGDAVLFQIQFVR